MIINNYNSGLVHRLELKNNNSATSGYIIVQFETEVDVYHLALYNAIELDLDSVFKNLFDRTNFIDLLNNIESFDNDQIFNMTIYY